MASIEDFAGKEEAFVAEWLTQQGLQKLIDVFKGMYCHFTLLLFLIGASCMYKYNFIVSIKLS